MMFLAALADAQTFPYVYYQVLRVVVCGTAIYGAMKYYVLARHGGSVMMILLALLFNPVAPVTLPRNLWRLLDFWLGIFLLVAGNYLVTDSEAHAFREEQRRRNPDY